MSSYSELNFLRFDSNSSNGDSKDSFDRHSKEDSSLCKKEEEVCEASITVSTSLSSTSKEDTSDTHGEHHPNSECNIPNIEDFNSNSSYS